MAYVKITPALIASALRSIAKGETPKDLSPECVAYHILETGFETEKQRARSATNDFVAFADQLYARTDSRQVGA